MLAATGSVRADVLLTPTFIVRIDDACATICNDANCRRMTDARPTSKTGTVPLSLSNPWKSAATQLILKEPYEFWFVDYLFPVEF